VGLAVHVSTWRPYTLWYAGLVGLAGAALATDDHSVARLAAAWLVPTLVWVAAHYLGDYLDRDLDALSKPQRPLPSGRMRPATALGCGIALVVVACGIAVAANYRTVVVLAFGVGGALAYNGLFKARGFSGNVTRGSITGAAFLFGEMMAAPYPPIAPLIFVVVFWAHDAASNLVGTLRDVDGDRAGGYRTFPVQHGLKLGGQVAAGLYAVSIVAAVGGLFVLPGNRPSYVLLLLIAAALGVVAFRMVVLAGAGLTARTALHSHEVLVVERMVLAGAPVAAGLGLPVTLSLLVPTVVLTVFIQRSMRARHEFAGNAALAVELPK
jgi:geranylgeranylglycerol-phosphate geranylgeranyltransferase